MQGIAEAFENIRCKINEGVEYSREPELVKKVKNLVLPIIIGIEFLVSAILYTYPPGDLITGALAAPGGIAIALQTPAIILIGTVALVSIYLLSD